MAIIHEINGITPVFGKDCFLSETAVVTGDVVCGDCCSFWFNAVVRGDVNKIRIGNDVNVQDNAVIHGTYRKAAVQIGDKVSVAHGAIVHGCTIEDFVLVGMGAVIMDHAVIKSNVIIAAGAVVRKKDVLESGYVYAGTPAKAVKKMDESLLNGEINRIADAYPKYASWYR